MDSSKKGSNMEEKINNPKLVVVSILVAIIVTSIGVAFGYFVWNSTSNTDISFTVSGAIVELDDGKDITGVNLMPTNSYTSGGKNVVKKEVKVKLKEATTEAVTVDFKLTINSIDSGLNHSTFKYNLVNSSGTSVKTGNFATSKKGDSINLLTLSTTDGTLTTSTTIYTLYIYIDGTSGDNPSSMQNQSFNFSFDVVGSNSSMEKTSSSSTIVNTIEALDDGSTGDSGSGVYKVTHSVITAGSSATGKEIPSATDYRYYGASPNNYICLDNTSGTCEDKHLYRIIGSIYEENAGQNLIKVIKATPLTNGSTTYYPYDSSGSNIWATITSGTYSNNLTSGSSLMKLLNSGDWWTSSNTYASYGLSATAKNLVHTSRYYLGGYNETEGVTINQWYTYERGTNKYNTSPTYWDGYVGLMYPSDYGYAAGNNCVTNTTLYEYDNGCKGKAWMYNSEKWTWLMTPVSNTNNDAFDIASSGFIDYGNDGVTGEGYVYPVFYLTPTTTITDGTGTSIDPYILS